MPTPILTFTPVMFAAARHPLEFYRKTVTRRLNHPGSQPPYGPDGTILPTATTWGVEQKFDDLRPSDLIQERIAQMGIWFEEPGVEKPSWVGISRPARFLSKHLYHLLPQAEIISTRAENLHAITEADVLAEGLRKITKDNGQTWKYGLADADGLPGNDDSGWPWQEWDTNAAKAYFKLWDSINAKRLDGLYAAEKNPTVWRVQFRLV